MRRLLIFQGLFLLFIFYESSCSYAQNINPDVVSLSIDIIQGDEHNDYDVMIMVDIDEGWFIFSEVPFYSPFHPLYTMIHLPEGHEKLGDMELHGVHSRNIASGLAVYEGFFIFIQHVRINEILEPQDIECEIVYQAGEFYSFQPVQMKKISLSL